MIPQKDKMTILVVDDNPENIHVLIENLEAEYTIVCAINGRKALEIAFSKERIDLILLDIMMPGMDGYEVCAKLKTNADTLDIPVIFISALDQEVDETKGLQLGAIDFISKPFSIPVVEARIKTALRLKKEMDRRVFLSHKLKDLNQNLEQRIKEKIAELERAHEDLKSSEKKYRTIYENAVEGIFQSSPEGHLLSASPSLARILGYGSPLELVESVADIASQLYRRPEDRNELKSILEQKGEVIDFVTQCKKKNGEFIWAMLCAKAVRTETDGFAYYQGFLVDITKRKQAEEEIRRNYDTQTVVNSLLTLSQKDISLDELLKQALDHILAIDWLSLEARGCIFLVDNGAQILEMKARRGFPKSLEELCAAVPYGRCLCGRAAKSCKIQFAAHVDQCHELTYPEMAPHAHYCVPVLLAGNLLGVINLYLPDGHLYDSKEEDFLSVIANTLAGIIERRRMVEEKEKLAIRLRQAQKMEAIGTLAGGIAHDFNNILAAILGFAELTKVKLPPESEIIGNIEQIIRAGSRAKDLVAQILAFSRQAEYERKPLQVNLVIKEALKLLRASLPATIEILEDIDVDSIVQGDPTEIHQVLMNLCTNAYHAMRDKGGVLGVELKEVEIEKGDLKVSALHLTPGPYLVLKVSDTGCGMDQVTKERIFEPYFTTKEKGEGSGLGLAVVHGIIKSHQGHISVYSEPGEGTAFQVYLPIIRSATIVSEVKSADVVASGHESILIVDDEPSIVEVEQKMLEGFGYQVTAVTSCKEALEEFCPRPEKFDLIITDMTMPYMTGQELAQRCFEVRADIPIILCTGFSELINKEKAKAVGFREFIMKPIVLKEMARVVRKVLDENSREAG